MASTHKVFLTITLVALVLLGSSSAQTSMMDEHFNKALAQVGLDTTDLALDLHDRGFYGGDKYRLPFFDALIADPLKISPYVDRLTTNLLDSSGELGPTLIQVQARLNQGIRLGLIGDPVEAYRERIAQAGDDCLAVAISELYGTLRRTAQVRPEEDYQALPKPVKEAAALLLFAVQDAVKYRNTALEPVLSGENQASFEQIWKLVLEEDDSDEWLPEVVQLEPLLDSVDFNLLNTGATLLALAVDSASASLLAAAGSLRTVDFHFAAETPLGLVELNGSAHDRYANPRGYLLVIDTRGDERYTTVAANLSAELPISLCLDLRGDDIYTSTDDSLPSFGAGVLGYAILADLGGDDDYNAQSVSQGAGIFGVGILHDVSGDDHYSGISLVQGSGTYGTGLLVDGGGSDVYRCYTLSQGYGFTLGAGLLLDVSGNDRYQANDTDIRFASAQSAEHNSSLSQGFGFGRRADFTDGHSWAGGLGMLVDGSGDDEYSCSVFGQGCAYWYGIGILADKAGADSYSGQWYCQGSGAHFALGILQDNAGNDTYNAAMNMCIGAGHDFSLGWLEDMAGDDSYTAPNLSLGAGNANGYGVFWDHGGNDTYRTKGTTLGQASSARAGSLRDFITTLGVFIDGGGDDLYLDNSDPGNLVPFDFCGDGMSWTRPGKSNPPLDAEKGCGIDVK